MAFVCKLHYRAIHFQGFVVPVENRGVLFDFFLHFLLLLIWITFCNVNV